MLTGLGLAAPLAAGAAIEWEDEMWIGLTGKGRRVWGPIGESVRQRVDTSKDAQQLALRVNPRTGSLSWQWLPNLRTETFVAVVQEWHAAGVAAVVWDGGGAHLSQAVQEASLVTIQQPAHAPELNPVERLIQVLRAEVEGRAHHQLSRKKAAVEVALARLAADPERVRRLVGWDWILAALTAVSPVPALSEPQLVPP